MPTGVMTNLELPDVRPPTLVETLLQSNRLATTVPLVVLPLVSWAWIAVMALDMYGPMTGASRWMMTATWDVQHLLLLFAMWAVMMTGMMLPSATPVVLLYGAMARRGGERSAVRRIYALAGGYLAVWAVFGLAATALQRLLANALLVTPMMELSSPILGAILLLVAGTYQLTPFKVACLRTCQSPFG